MSKSKTVLVTGAGGFIGKNVCLRLRDLKYNVLELDNLSRFGNKKINQKNLINGSVFDKKLMKRLISKSDIIIHMAAINGTKNFYSRPKEVFEVGIRGIMNIYDCLPTKTSKKILIASSGEVYGEPKYIPTDENIPLTVSDIFNNRYSYGGGKIVQDLVARYLISSKAKDCTVFRPHNVYGPQMGYDHVIPELLKKTLNANRFLEIQGTGNETRAFCYIDDFLDGLLLLIKKRFNHFDIFNIGNPTEVKIKTLAKTIIKKSKKKLKIKHIKIEKGSSKRRCPDISKLSNLGYKPKIDLEKGIDKFIKLDNLFLKKS